MKSNEQYDKTREQKLGFTPQALGIALRQMPVNLVAEQALLGAILSNNKAFTLVADFLEPSHFADPVNARIYGECARRIIAGQVANGITLRTWFAADSTSHDVGGVSYLADLLTAMVGIWNAGDYGRQIKDAWARRLTIEAAQDLMDSTFDQSIPLDEAVSRLNASVDHAAGVGDAKLITFDEAAAQAMVNLDEAIATYGQRGLNIGNDFPRTKSAINFLSRKFIVGGGDTGMGKSALIWRWMTNAAMELRDKIRGGTPKSEVGGILGVTLEMDATALALRAACAFCGVCYHDAEAGRISPFMRDQIDEAFAEMKSMPLTFVSLAGMTPNMIIMRARQAMRAFGGKLAAIVIDHLQLLEADGESARGGGAWAMRSIIATFIAMPKLFNCLVLALSQIKAEVRERKNKRPHENDFAWGSAIGQAADYAFFIYREAYYLRKDEPRRDLGEDPIDYQKRHDDWKERLEACEHQAELVLTKSRGGFAKTIHLVFDGPTMVFSEDPSYAH